MTDADTPDLADRRLKTVLVSRDLWLDMFGRLLVEGVRLHEPCGRGYDVHHGIPSGSKVVAAVEDGDDYRLTVRHEDFAPVPLGREVPEYDGRIEAVRNDWL